MRFVSDPPKAAKNRRKHGVTFAEAATAFEDVHAVLAPDYEHADRALMIAHAESGRLLLVIFIEIAPDLVRIISARPATRAERRRYEEDDEE